MTDSATRSTRDLPQVEQALRQAIAYHQAGQLPDAERAYRAILEAHPGHPDASHNLGVLAVQVNKPIESLPFFRAAVEARPEHEHFWLSYIDALFLIGDTGAVREALQRARQQGLSGQALEGRAARLQEAAPAAAAQGEDAAQSQTLLAEMNAVAALYNSGDFSEALAAALPLTERYPQQAFLWNLLGALQKQIGQQDDATASYRRALEIKPDYAEAHNNLGAALRDLGRQDEAMAHYRQALDIDPDFAEANNNLGSALGVLGRHDEAVACYIHALKTRPGLAEVHNNLGTSLHACGRFAEAEASFRKALELEPDHVEAQSNLGSAQYEQGRLEDAVASQQAALQKKPGFAVAHCRLANALRDLGRREQAVASYRRAVEINPGNVEALNNLGNVLHDLGRLDEAVASYRRGLELRPDIEELHNNLGSSLLRLGRLEEAEACYRRAMEIAPDYADARANLAAVMMALGRCEEAIESCAQAIRLKPDYAEAYNNLGNAQRELRQLDAAEASYKRALDIKPDFAEAHNNLGAVMHDWGKYAESEAYYRQALEIRPDFVEAIDNLATTLQYVGKSDEALALYHRALEIRPDYVEAHVNLGATLRDLDRLDEAMACCRRALEIKPDFAEAYVVMATILSATGQFAAAEEALDKALDISHDLPAAWAEKAGLRKMTVDDVAWLEQAKRLMAGPLPDKIACRLEFAMGKYYDDTGDYDNAFAGYGRGNALRRTREGSYDRQANALLTNLLTKAYDRDLMVRVLPGASTSMRPVFIVGMPRSGTSLTEQILASHPAVFGAGELPYWGDKFQCHYAPAIAGELDAALLAELAEGCLAHLDGKSSQASRVVDKMPGNFRFLGLIHAVFPQARILHTQRNPIDTCLSIYFQNFTHGHAYANDLEDLAHYYREYHRLMNHWREVLPPEVLLDVPYEALVEDQEGWSRRILEFLGLDWDETCLDFHKTERRVGTASNWQARQPIYKSSKERWRNYEKYVGPLLPLLDLYNPSAGKT